jgi:hypothetical protein
LLELATYKVRKIINSKWTRRELSSRLGVGGGGGGGVGEVARMSEWLFCVAVYIAVKSKIHWSQQATR